MHSWLCVEEIRCLHHQFEHAIVHLSVQKKSPTKVCETSMATCECAASCHHFTLTLELALRTGISHSQASGYVHLSNIVFTIVTAPQVVLSTFVSQVYRLMPYSCPLCLNLM